MSDNLELSASITTEEPEVAADLDQLRYLVFQGKKGDTGDSAYEEAVELGFVGTEAEWIASLKGEKGDTGYSPEIRVTDITGGHRLDIYNELGYETVDVMDGIDGTDGEDGEDGTDGVSPTVTVQNIAGGHSVTITDATHPQGQSFAVMNGSGIPEDVKVALLDCFENVAWINDQGQTYYDALYAALYPPKTLVSISAVFTQGSAVIYDTDSLDTLKQYLTVTATYDDTSTGVVTNYTLSGTLTVGTSTITVSYGGKTTTFTVTVTHRDVIPAEYQQVEYVASNGNAYFTLTKTFALGTVFKSKVLQTERDSVNNRAAVGGMENTAYEAIICVAGYKRVENNVGGFYSYDGCWVSLTKAYTEPTEITTEITASAMSVTAKNSTENQSNTISVSGKAIKRFYVFWDGRTGNAFIGRIYDIEVKDANDNILAHFIPCYRISDNAVGMYEIVGETFHVSDTSTDFTRGGNV